MVPDGSAKMLYINVPGTPSYPFILMHKICKRILVVFLLGHSGSAGGA